MDIKELQEKLESARGIVVRLADELAGLENRAKTLQDEVSINWKAQRSVSSARFDANLRVRELEGDLEVAVARQVAEGCDGPSREELRDELRVALRSKTGKEHELLKWLEQRRRYGGANGHWGTIRLTGMQQVRVNKVMRERCPTHPTTGNMLPPYVVE